MAKIRCLPIYESVSGTPCLIEKAWICMSLSLEEAQNCNRDMHSMIGMCGFGKTAVV